MNELPLHKALSLESHKREVDQMSEDQLKESLKMLLEHHAAYKDTVERQLKIELAGEFYTPDQMG